MSRVIDIQEVLVDLTEKQRRFCEEYVVDCNKRQAAIRAKYSPKEAGYRGWELFRLPNVKLYIEYLMDKRAKRVAITADDVVREIAAIAFYNPHDMIESIEAGNVRLKDLTEMDYPEAIKTIKIKTTYGSDGKTEVGYVTELVLHDKLKALELLGKHNALFTDNLNLSNTAGDLPAAQVTNNIYVNHRAKGQPLIDSEIQEEE